MTQSERSDSEKRGFDAPDSRSPDAEVDSGRSLDDPRGPQINDDAIGFGETGAGSEGFSSCGSNQAGMKLDADELGNKIEPASCVDGAVDNSAIPMGELPGSVSVLISKVKEGDEDSVRELWNRYSGALVRSAQSRISKQVAAKVDSEDLAQSVFFAIYRGAVEDKFDQLNDRAGFWTLVLAITRRKAVDRIRKLTAAKRGGVAAMRVPQGGLGDSGDDFITRLPSREVDPQVEVECHDLLESLKEQLDAEDDTGMLTRVAVSRIAGLSVKEIAAELERTERTVERKLSLIRSLWSETMPNL